jgi:hypothetical protein
MHPFRQFSEYNQLFKIGAYKSCGVHSGGQLQYSNCSRVEYMQMMHISPLTSVNLILGIDFSKTGKHPASKQLTTYSLHVTYFLN